MAPKDAVNDDQPIADKLISESIFMGSTLHHLDSKFMQMLKSDYESPTDNDPNEP